MTTLLEQRNIAKKKKPKFRQHDSHKRKSIISAWRAPKGLQNKMRRSFKGYARKVSIGFGSPREVKHLTRSGKRLMLVHSIADLDKLHDAEGVIASNIGKRKRKLIAEAALSKNIVLNNMDAQKFLAHLSKQMEERKQTSISKAEKKAEQEEKESKNLDEKLSAEQQKNKEEKKTETTQQKTQEEKKKEEKAERDKVITKRDTQ